MAVSVESPEQRFRTRYGVGPDDFSLTHAFTYLTMSMDTVKRVSDAQGKLQELIDGLLKFGEEDAVRAVTRTALIPGATDAIKYLFPDGPISIEDHIRKMGPGYTPDPDFLNRHLRDPRVGGQRAKAILDAYITGDDEPFRGEFNTVAALLSDVSDVDIRFLGGDPLFKVDHHNLISKTTQGTNPFNLSLEQVFVLTSRGIVPLDRRPHGGGGL